MTFKPSKKNKTKINCRHRPWIKEDYFNWLSANQIAAKYWYDYYVIKKYIEWSATKNYEHNWVKMRRCSICWVRRRTSMYWRNYEFLNADCKICRAVMRKNNNQILINTWRKENELARRRKSWEKRKWKYNTRRRILRIIWYLDPWGKKNYN